MDGPRGHQALPLLQEQRCVEVQPCSVSPLFWSMWGQTSSLTRTFVQVVMDAEIEFVLWKCVWFSRTWLKYVLNMRRQTAKVGRTLVLKVKSLVAVSIPGLSLWSLLVSLCYLSICFISTFSLTSVQFRRLTVGAADWWGSLQGDRCTGRGLRRRHEQAHTSNPFNLPRTFCSAAGR